MAILDWLSGRVFNTVHRNNLVYNTCWEDPRLDRVALELGPRDNLLVITSAGCNALDYALTGLNHVYAVDMNPRQNALLDLKIAAIKNLDYEDFFAMFGQGRLRGVRQIYRDTLRDSLPSRSRSYWDRRIVFFDSPQCSFYFRGTSGYFARVLNAYIDKVIRIRPSVDALLRTHNLDEQKQIYEGQVHDRLFSKPIRFAMKRDTTLSMVGVPKAQRQQIENQYDGGILQFVVDCVVAVFTEIPLIDNYFWRVYMTGGYTQECCPEYLKPENFEKLRGGLIDNVSTHTDSVQGFLDKNDVNISRFVLLDHMDWLSDKFFPLLEAEWQSILSRAASATRVIWRSGGLRTDFVNDVQVTVNGEVKSLPELLTFHPDLAEELHAQDRVHTYGSFYIADVAA